MKTVIPGASGRSPWRGVFSPASLGSILLFGAVVSYLWIFVWTVHGQGDEGLILYSSERVLRGQVPYRDFFSELAPGSFYLQAFFFKAFGTHVASARVPTLFLLAAIAWLLFSLGRRIVRPWVATLPVLIYVVTAFTRWMVVSHHWYSLFFALLGAIFLVRYLENRRHHWLFWAGLSVSACGICMQSKGAFVLLAFVGLLILHHRRARSSSIQSMAVELIWFTSGGAALTIACLYYFYSHGSLDDLIYSTFTYLWQSYLPYDFQPHPLLSSSRAQQFHATLADFSLLRIGKLLSILIWSLLIPLAAVAFTRLSSPPSEGEGRDPELRRITCGVYLALGFALLLSEMHRFDFVHMLFGAPVLLILAVGFLDSHARSGTWRSHGVTALLLSLTLFYLGHGASLAWRESKRNAPLHTRRGTLYQSPERASTNQKLIDYISGAARPGAEVLVYPYSSMLYFLTETNNPTRYDYLLPGQTTSAQFGEVLSLLESDKAPALIVSTWRGLKESLPMLYPSVPLEVFEDHPIERFLQGAEGKFRILKDDPLFVVYVALRETSNR